MILLGTFTSKESIATQACDEPPREQSASICGVRYNTLFFNKKDRQYLAVLPIFFESNL